MQSNWNTLIAQVHDHEVLKHFISILLFKRSLKKDLGKASKKEIFVTLVSDPEHFLKKKILPLEKLKTL